MPYFIDWTSYKADFEREASRVLGREVVVRGDARARLLPLPSVTFTDVEVAGATPGVPAVTVETFSMDAELAPFLRGELLIFDMRIERPKARIAIAEDGTIDWALRPNTPFDASQVTLENVTIIEGRIDVEHAASGRTHELTEVNAAISARTLAGPWRMTGSMRLDGMLTDLSISTGALEDDGTMRLRIRAAPERYGFEVDSDGRASLRDGAFGYEGPFKVTARKTERLRASDGETVPLDEGKQADAPPAYRVSGDFKLDHQMIDVSEFRFETGPVVDPYVAHGAASIVLGEEPRFDIKADGAQLRFEDVADAEDGSLALADRLAAIKEVMFDLPKPEIPGTIAVNLPAIVAGDTTVRNVTLSAEPVEKGWSIGALSATLPGRATLEGNGFLNTTFGEFGFQGQLLLAVGQPSGFAAWLSKDVDEAIRRLPAAGFGAKVELSEERQVFEDLELQLGAAAFSGRIVNEQPTNRRPSMTLALDGGRLDVEGLAAFASLFVSDSGATRLADHDFDFKIKAGPVTVAGITAESADTALRLRDGRLEIDKLALTGVEGASISATGSVNGIGSSPTGLLDASVIAGDLAPLISLAAERFPDNVILAALNERSQAFPGIFGDARMDLRAELAEVGADEHRMVFSIKDGTAGGSTIDFGLTATGSLDDPYGAETDIWLTASNEEPGAIYALYGIPALPFGFAGALGTELEIAGTLKDGATAKFRAAGDGLVAQFEGTVSAEAGKFSASGDASIEATDLEPYLMTAGVTLPGMGLGVSATLSANLDLADGILIASGLTGTIGGNQIRGDINASMRDGLPHFTGAVNLDSLDLGLVVASVLGEASMDMEAGGVWPRIPFEPSARPPFTAELDIAAVELLLNGVRHAKNARMSARMNREGARLADATAIFNGGTIGGLLELSNNGGTGLFSGQIKATGAPVTALLPDVGLTGEVDFSASLTANGKSIEGMMASLSGSGTASVDEVIIPGLSPDALTPIMAAADELGTDIDNERTAALAPPLVQDGVFKTAAAEFALTVAGGVVRTPPIVLERPEATLTAEARVDLGMGTVGASGDIAYDPGLDAVVGAEPSVRFEVSGAPGNVTVNLDTAPLGQFLTQRALEREQARVEAMQAQLLERQRLRREVRYYASLQEERERLAEEILRIEEAARASEEARRAAGDETRRRAEEEARLRAEEEAQRQSETQGQVTQTPPAEDIDVEIQRETLPPPTSGDAVSAPNMTVEGLLRAIEE